MERKTLPMEVKPSDRDVENSALPANGEAKHVGISVMSPWASPSVAMVPSQGSTSTVKIVFTVTVLSLLVGLGVGLALGIELDPDKYKSCAGDHKHHVDSLGSAQPPQNIQVTVNTPVTVGPDGSHYDPGMPYYDDDLYGMHMGPNDDYLYDEYFLDSDALNYTDLVHMVDEYGVDYLDSDALAAYYNNAQETFVPAGLQRSAPAPASSLRTKEFKTLSVASDDTNAFDSIGDGCFTLWWAASVDHLTDKNQWAGFNNNLRTPCADCVPIDTVQDCDPQYLCADANGAMVPCGTGSACDPSTLECLTQFNGCTPNADKAPFPVTDFEHYTRWSKTKRGKVIKSKDLRNVNGKGFEGNNFVLWDQFEAQGKTFAEDQGVAVETVSMAKHCHFTLRDDTCRYVMEEQHNTGRDYDDLSEPEHVNSGQMSFGSILDMWNTKTDEDSGKDISGPVVDRCDCTRYKDKANGCGVPECLAVGVKTGVMCNNCGGRCNRCWAEGYCTHNMHYTKEQFEAGEAQEQMVQQMKCAACLSVKDIGDEYFNEILMPPHEQGLSKKETVRVEEVLM